MEILLTHGYSDSNKGDLAIVYATIKEIQRQRPDATIRLHSVYSKYDDDFNFHSRFIKKLGVKVEEGIIPSPYIDSNPHSLSRNLFATLRLFKWYVQLVLVDKFPKVFSTVFKERYERLNEFNASDIVIAKGGQYIYNDQSLIRGYLYLWRMLLPFRLGKKKNKKTILLGQSIGPVNGDWANKKVKSALKGVSEIVVREKLSYSLMEQLNLEDKTILRPDMAFLIEPKEIISEKIEALFKHKKVIGITMVNWYFPERPDVGEAKKEYKDTIKRFAKYIRNKYKYEIIFFPQVTVKHHGESDIDLIKEVIQELEKEGVSSNLVDDDLSPEELSYLYGRCELLLGTRLHSCILAACAGTPVVAIRYQGYKTEGVMQSLGLDEYVFDINFLDADAIIKKVDYALANRLIIKEKIKEKVQKFKNELKLTIQSILNN